MKCLVPSQNFKVLAKTLHSLGRIGEDLFIEPHRTQLTLRTVNLAESAYASFTFAKSFFSSFTFIEDDNEDTLRCKISMKSLLVVLRSQHGDKMIEWCQLRLDPNGTKVVFQLRYSYGCTKTHFLPILESETLQANYSKEDSQNQISVLPKLLSTAVKNFRFNEDEITLTIMSEKLVLKNHLENNLDSKKALRTEICLYPEEFETYNILAPTSVTFCLKELRAVLLFAEFTGLPIHFYICAPGKPAVFAVENDTVYEGNYLVSTLSESSTSQLLSQSSESSVTTNPKGPVNLKKRSHQELNENGGTSQTNISNKSVCTSPGRTSPLSGPALSGVNALSTSDIHDIPCLSSEPLEATGNSNVTQPVINSVFGRCFNTTFKKQSLPGFNKVLAYDSDGMEDSD